MVCKIRLGQGSARPEVVGFQLLWQTWPMVEAIPSFDGPWPLKVMVKQSWNHWTAIRNNGLASLVKKHWMVNIYVLSRTIERFKCLNTNFRLEHYLKRLPLRTSAAWVGVIWRPVNIVSELLCKRFLCIYLCELDWENGGELHTFKALVTIGESYFHKFGTRSGDGRDS